MSTGYDVVVLGAGVTGLTSAVRLAESGLRVLVLTADEPARTVSRVAAAVWYPTRTAEDPRVLRWARHTFDELMTQAGSGIPGTAPRPTRMLLRNPVTGAPWWSAAVPDFRRLGPAGPYTDRWEFTVPSVEMGPYLEWLVERLTTAGAVLRQHRVSRLDEAAEFAPVVVNATGLSAGALAGDPRVHPIRGRIVLVANPGLVTSVRDEESPAGLTYVHPRSRDVVLGGTFEPGQSGLAPDESASRAILARAVALVPELAGAPVLDRLAGLRPGRHGGIRLEVDPVGLPGGVRLIHNYGHGGAGVTLAWGCADEVAALVAAD